MKETYASLKIPQFMGINFAKGIKHTFSHNQPQMPAKTNHNTPKPKPPSTT